MKKKLGIIALVLAGVLILAAAGIFCFAKYYLNKIERIDPEQIDVIAPENEDFEIRGDKDPEEAEAISREEELAQQQAQEPEPAPEPEPEPEPELEPEPVPTDEELAAAIDWSDIGVLNDDELINILLVGQDTRTEERARSDTMILCSFNPKTNQVSLISFLRDLYVSYPQGYSDNRLNAAYRFGGMPLLYQVLEQNFGVVIDAGIEVNFSGFEELVNLLGGVELYMTQAEADAINLMDPTTEKHEGMNFCDGRDTLKYSRLRHIDNDFHRTDRQRYMLTTLYENVRSADLTTLMALLDSATGYIRTDMSDEDIINLAIKLAPMLSGLEISTYRVPGDGAYENQRIREMAVLVPNLDMIRWSLQTEYLPYSPEE